MVSILQRLSPCDSTHSGDPGREPWQRYTACPERAVGRTRPSACWHTKAELPADMGTAMTTVYLVTAGSGDTYRIERVYLDSDQAYSFAQDYNGIAPVEPVQVEEWQVGAPPAVYDGPYWRAEWWARMPVAKRHAELRDTDEGERFDDFAVRQGWWTGRPCPKRRWCVGRWPGYLGLRWQGCPRTRWRRSSGTRSPRRGPSWPECPGNSLHSLRTKRKKADIATRHCRPHPS